MALSPPVSAISGAPGARVSAIFRLMTWAVSVEPVKQTPAMRGSDVIGPPTRRAIARQQLHRAPGYAGLVHQPDRPCGDQRRLLGGLGDDRVAGGQRAEDLAGERSPAGSSRAKCRRSRHAGPRPHLRKTLGLVRVVAGEIRGLAHFADAIEQRLAGFARGERKQLRRIRFVEVCATAQAGGTLLDRQRRPFGGPSPPAAMSAAVSRPRTA